jgi:hypothetical protein
MIKIDINNAMENLLRLRDIKQIVNEGKEFYHQRIKMRNNLKIN